MASLLPAFVAVICVMYSSTSSSDLSYPCPGPDCIDAVEQFFVDPQKCPYYEGEVHPSLLNFEYCVYIIPLGNLTSEFWIPRPTDNFTDIFLQIIRPNCERQLPIALSYYPVPTWTNYPVPVDVIYRCCPKTGCSCSQCTAAELKHEMIFWFIEHIETGNSSRTCFNRDHDPVPTYPGVDTCVLAMSLATRTSEGLSRIVNGPMSFNGFAGYPDCVSTASYQLRQEGCMSWTAANGTVAEGYIPDGYCLRVLRPSAYEVLCCCYHNTDACKFYGRQGVPRKDDNWIRSLPPQQLLAGRQLTGAQALIDGRVKFHCIRAKFEANDFLLEQIEPRDEILGDVADACRLQMTVTKNGTNATHGFYMQLEDADIQKDCRGSWDYRHHRKKYAQPMCRTKLVGNDKENLVVNYCCTSGDFCNHPFVAFPSLSETLHFATPLMCDPSDQLEFAARHVTSKDSISSMRVCHVPWDIEARRLSTEFYQFYFSDYPVMWELKVEPFNITCRWYLAWSWSGCYRDDTTEVLLPRLLFTCEVPVADYKEVMSTLDINAAYEQVKLRYGCSTTHGRFVDYSSYILNCNSNQQCIESMGHSAGCYAILQRTPAGVLQIQAGSVVNRTDVAKLYPRDMDESGKKIEKIASHFRKFTQLNSSGVVMVCAMANMSACNLYYHRMLYVYHAHLDPTGYNAMGSLVQTCGSTSDGRACLEEDDCFLDVDLEDKANQEGQCYRRSGWTSSINQSSTICDSLNSSDHCYAVQRDTGEMHLLCCCVDQCSNDIVGQSTAYGFRLRK
ncbi:hypothetical protein AAVH_09845 [Aphelenchoides avenae]|nr:hypothetical protein AAVH_09845 [Aphelenchus avenae]